MNSNFLRKYVRTRRVSLAASPLHVLTIPAYVVHPVNAKLIERQKAERARLGDRPVKWKGRPVDFERMPGA